MLAHQGGWDEILLVLGPIAIIAGLLYLAKQRVKQHAPATDAGGPDEPAAPATPDDQG